MSQFAYYYRYAKEVYLPLMNSGQKVKTKDFATKAGVAFAMQKLVTSWEDAKLARRKVPFKDSSPDYPNRSKRVRDFNKIVHNLLVNVSKGVFPGDYLTASVKNQSVQRAVQRKRTGKPRGVNPKRYVNVIKREELFDPYRSKTQ